MESLYANIVSTAGSTATVSGFVYVGRKLQILDGMQEDIKKLKANLKVVTDYLTRTHAGFDPRELQHYSPLQLSPQGDRNFLKVFFYNNPTRNLQNMAPTLGVYIRDRYLAEHPEISE